MSVANERHEIGLDPNAALLSNWSVRQRSITSIHETGEGIEKQEKGPKAKNTQRKARRYY